MPTAIIGTGTIGSAVVTHLTEGGVIVILASRTAPGARQLAVKLGALAAATGIADAIKQADTVLFAVWLDAMKEPGVKISGEAENHVGSGRGAERHPNATAGVAPGPVALLAADATEPGKLAATRHVAGCQEGLLVAIGS